MADGVRYILDKLAALFRRLEDTELFTKVLYSKKFHFVRIETVMIVVALAFRMKSGQLSRR